MLFRLTVDKDKITEYAVPKYLKNIKLPSPEPPAAQKQGRVSRKNIASNEGQAI